MSETPAGLGPRGTRLWLSLLAQDDALEDDANPMREVALQAARTADRLDDLDAGLATCGDEQQLRLMTEERQQSTTLARLVSALRLPDEASGKRPQRRQIRGVQKPSKVSSLERARQRATGS